MVHACLYLSPDRAYETINNELSSNVLYVTQVNTRRWKRGAKSKREREREREKLPDKITRFEHMYMYMLSPRHETRLTSERTNTVLSNKSGVRENWVFNSFLKLQLFLIVLAQPSPFTDCVSYGL